MCLYVLNACVSLKSGCLLCMHAVVPKTKYKASCEQGSYHSATAPAQYLLLKRLAGLGSSIPLTLPSQSF